MRIISYLITLIIILIGITFAALNAEPVAINYYLGASETPLSLLLIIAMLFGVFLGLCACLVFYWKQKSLVSKLKQRLKITEAEVAKLRVLPLKD